MRHADPAIATCLLTLALTASCTRSGFWQPSGDGGTLDGALPEGGSGDGAPGEDGSTPPISLAVGPAFPTAGANWNDYVALSSGQPPLALDQPCNAASDDLLGKVCAHGGELRRVTVTGVSTCAGLTLQDDLDAFDWQCAEESGAVVFYSTGLKSGRGLRQLIDTSGWRANRVVLGGTAQAVSASGVWYANPVVALPANSGAMDAVVPLDGVDDDGPGPDQAFAAGTIFTLAESRASAGYNLNADKLGLVAFNGATLTWTAGAAANCEPSSGETTGATQRCLLAAGSQSFTWIEGLTLDGGSYTPTAGHCVLAAGLHFSQTHALALRNCSGAASFALVGPAHGNLIRGLSTHGGDPGLLLSAATHNIVEEVVTTGSASDGLRLSGGASTNRLQTITGRDNAQDGVAILLSAGNALVDVAAERNGRNGIFLQDSDSNSIERAWAQSNGSAGVALNSASDNRLAVIRSAEDASAGVALTSGSNRNHFFDLVISNSHYEGLEDYGSTDNVYVQVLLADNADDGQL